MSKRMTILLVVFSILFLYINKIEAGQVARYGCQPANNCFGFYEYLPNSYNVNNNDKHPVIIYLHGLSLEGNGDATQIKKLLLTAIPSYINKNQWPASWNFMVFSPQDNTGWWNAAKVTNVLDYITFNYPKIDKKRIYLTGMSAGGGGVWSFASAGNTQAQRVAAIVPICGAASPTTSTVNVLVNNKVPVWAFHNQNDPTVSVTLTNNWITNLNAKSINPVAKKTIYPVNGHDAWTAAYNPSSSNPNNIYSWMLNYTRPLN